MSNTGLKSSLHTPKDEAHLIDYNVMALITEHLKNVVESVSRDTDYQPLGEISPKYITNTNFNFQLIRMFIAFHFLFGYLVKVDGTPRIEDIRQYKGNEK